MRVLVIGYGNALRGDDGAGFVVAETVRDWLLPDVGAIAVHQLLPELAADIAEVAEEVWFVDAAIAHGNATPQVQALAPRWDRACGHTCSPQTLLALAALLYDRLPAAWLLTIPAQGFELGAGFSPLTVGGISHALHLLDAQLRAQDTPCTNSV